MSCPSGPGCTIPDGCPHCAPIIAARDAEIARLTKTLADAHTYAETNYHRADATISELRAELGQARKAHVAAEDEVLQLRAEVKGAAALYDEGVAHGEALSRADKAEAECERLSGRIGVLAGDVVRERESRMHTEVEVERLRGACDNACKVAVDASNLVHALQADLTEARAVVRRWADVNEGNDTPLCRDTLAVLAKSEGGT